MLGKPWFPYDMKIPITFLGTSQAIPTATRNHTAILLNYKEESILVDCGEGTQRQFRKLSLNPCRLTRLLITHWHGDHILGIPGLLQTLALNDYNKTLHIYGPKGTKKYIQDITSIFLEKQKIKIKVEEVTGKFLETKDFELIALPLIHGGPTNGYIFQEKNKLRIHKDKLKKLKLTSEDRPKIALLSQGKDIKLNGKTIKAKTMTYGQKGRKIAFILDTKVNPNANKLAKDADLAIIESTYFDETDLATKYKHLTLHQAAEIAKKNNVKRLILTHISQRYEFKEKILEKAAQKIFKNSTIARDKMRVEV